MARVDPAAGSLNVRETVLCPYCGVPLFTARDRAEHLDLKRCRHEGAAAWDCADCTDPHARPQDRCDCGRAAR